MSESTKKRAVFPETLPRESYEAEKLLMVFIVQFADEIMSDDCRKSSEVLATLRRLRYKIVCLLGRSSTDRYERLIATTDQLEGLFKIKQEEEWGSSFVKQEEELSRSSKS